VRRTFQGQEVKHLRYPTMLPDESREPHPPILQASDFARRLLELRNLFREMSKLLLDMFRGRTYSLTP
jgi:hypothetical protein